MEDVFLLSNSEIKLSRDLQLFFEMLLTVTFEAMVLVMYWNLKANEHPKLFGLR